MAEQADVARVMRYVRWTALGLVLPGFAGCVYVGTFGSAIVHDETGEVVGAVVTNDHREQALLRLPGRLFFAIPRMEGTIEVRCRNGAKARWGYVTGSVHTSIRVTGPIPCARVVEDR